MGKVAHSHPAPNPIPKKRVEQIKRPNIEVVQLYRERLPILLVKSSCLSSSRGTAVYSRSLISLRFQTRQDETQHFRMIENPYVFIFDAMRCFIIQKVRCYSHLSGRLKVRFTLKAARDKH